MANKIKFQFDIEFQKEVLHYIVKETLGYQALRFFSYDTFELVEHQIIAYGLKKYLKLNKKMPTKPLLRDYMRQVFNEKQFESLIDDDLKKDSLNIINDIYNEPLLQGDAVFDKIKSFKKFTELKKIVEQADFHNFDISKFTGMATSIQKSLQIGDEHAEEDGTFLLKDIVERQAKRRIKSDVYPTPYWQLNQTTNAGGWENGSLVCLLGKAKWFKTGALINYTTSEIRMRKVIAYIDFENNEEPLSVRAEQRLTKLTKREILSGDHDRRIAKMLRQYKRIGAEVIIKRFPAYSTNFEDVQAWVDKIKLKHAIVPDIYVFDYLALMGSISRKKEEEARISDVYVDAKNFLLFNKAQLGITGHHVKDAGYARIGTKFKPNDTAMCLAIHRHVDVLLGLQQNDEEAEAGVLRIEIIDQRDGTDGKALFWIDFEKQMMIEFSKKEVKEYLIQTGDNEKNTRKKDDDL